MSSKLEKERQKQIQDRCQRLLTQMLKDDDNKYCVDCDAKGPRWASWNIGIFLCIRCAGIHRNLGVHISKVKSVNLDTWTPQQVVSLQQMGNSRARAVYEANLPDNFRRPQTDSSLEGFIRAKYEHKKYIAREWVQPSLPKVNWDKELEEEAEKLKKKKRDVKPATTIRPLSTPSVVPQPIPKPQSSTTSPKPARVTSHYTTDLLGLDTPTKECNKKAVSDSDLFANFMNSSSNVSSDASKSIENTAVSTTSSSISNGINTLLVSSPATTLRTAEEDNFFNQSTIGTPNKQKQLTTDSILALYGTTGAYNTPPMVNNMSSQQSYSIPQVRNGVVPSNFLPGQLNTSAVNLQNGITTHSNTSQFANLSNYSANPSAAFASNPFYPMAVATSAQTYAGFPAHKGIAPCAVPFSSNNGIDSQALITQQMGSINLNVPNMPNFVPSMSQSNSSSLQSSSFLMNSTESPKSFNQPLAATNEWK